MEILYEIIGGLNIKRCRNDENVGEHKKNFDNPERNNGELRADKFKGFITDEWNVDGFNVITVSGKKNKQGTRYIFAWRRICRRGDSISQKNY